MLKRLVQWRMTARQLLLLVVVILSAQFYACMQMHTAYIGQMARWYFEDQTARTLKFSRNWYRDGALNDYLLQLENVPSVEFETLQSRVPYLSFLPGGIVPVYLAALVTGKEPTLVSVQYCNLFTQYVVVLLLAYTVLTIGPGGKALRFLSALFAGIAYTWIPFLSYEHQQVYYNDAAVLIPYAAVFAMTAFRARYTAGRRWDVMICLLFAWFVFVNWLGIAVAGMWCLFRLAENRHRPFKTMAKSIWPAAVGVAMPLLFFVYQLYVTQLYTVFAHAVNFRANHEPFSLQKLKELRFVILDTYSVHAYGYVGAALIGMSTSYILWHMLATPLIRSLRPKTPQIYAWLEIASYCTVVQLILVYAMPRHYMHPYTVLWYGFALILAAFIFMPALLNEIAGRRLRFLPAAGVIAGFCYVLTIYHQQGWEGIYKKHKYVDYSIPEFLYQKAQYTDIVFSPNYETPIKQPTQDYAMAMKRVYHINNLAQIMNYQINDFEISYLRKYGANLPPYRLPVEKGQVFLLIPKFASCWPLRHEVQNILREKAVLIEENKTLAYYLLDQNRLRDATIPICGQAQ